MVVTAALLLGTQPCLGQQTSTVDSQTTTAGSKNRFKAPEPKETKAETSTNTWLIAGGAVALGIGVIALAGGGSSSGSSTTTTTEDTATDQSSTSTSSEETDSTAETSSEPTVTTTETVNEYTGPDLEGSGWHGTLIIENEGYEGTQAVTATISQNEATLSIRTSSSLSYARSFRGKISDGGYIVVQDAQTGKTWTTFEGAASTSYIRLYDYVNDNTAFDKLVLSR